MLFSWPWLVDCHFVIGGAIRLLALEQSIHQTAAQRRPSIGISSYVVELSHFARGEITAASTTGRRVRIPKKVQMNLRELLMPERDDRFAHPGVFFFTSILLSDVSQVPNPKFRLLDCIEMRILLIVRSSCRYAQIP